MEIKSLCISPKHIGNKITHVKNNVKEKITSKETWRLTRKKAVILGSVLLIGAAVYLNYIFFLGDTVNNAEAGNQTATEQQVNDVANTSDDYSETLSFFSQTSLERQKARDEALEVLQIVVDSDEAITESKNTAINQMNKIASDIQTEANIESLIESKGFEECVAVINEDECNIVVKSDGLMANEISQIKEIVYSQANIQPSDVKIIEKA